MSADHPTQPNHLVTVIIPTTCESRRSREVQRAIDSVLAQEGVLPRILLVANGDRFDPALLQSLRERRDLTLVYLPNGNVRDARAHGRSLVDTAFFCFLDDDDELMPHSLSLRLRTMLDDPSVDLVATNGYNVSASGQEPRNRNVGTVLADPAKAMVTHNWLASSAGLFRTATVTEADFRDLPEFSEWTLLAFRLACNRKVVFIDQLAYRIHDTAGSLSKSLRFVESDAEVIKAMLRVTNRPDLRRALLRKLSGSLHDISDQMAERGMYRKAWRYHLSSLRYPGGWKHLAATRKLFLRWVYAPKKIRD
ncbi:MAG TPA: glycosyltransferase family 2 protein [Pseudomonadales bacterium]